MALKLRVISDHYKELGKRSSRLFGVTGGRIGRAKDNDWILPDSDRYVSSHHCKVLFRAGEWLLEDTSTNGVFVNGSDTPVSVDGPYTLQDGDRLRLGEYEVLVSIDERNDFPPDASGQLPVPASLHGRTLEQPRAEEDLGEELDLTDLLGEPLPASAVPPPKPAAAAFDFAPPANTSRAGNAPAHGTAAKAASKAGDAPSSSPPILREAVPQARASRALAPHGGYASLLDGSGEYLQPRDAAPHVAPERADDWQMQTRPYDRRTMTALTSPSALRRPGAHAHSPADEHDAAQADAHAAARREPAPASQREPSRARRGGDHGDVGAGIEAFCRGAGIDPASLPSDTQSALLTLAGQMLREVVLGLMDVLKGRAELKSRLRLSQTTIQPGENNPLKFSASVDEAVRKLLDPHGSRYLGPIEAIRDSFSDLRTHQNALTAAIQAAINEIMSRIEPGELQERFDRGLKRGALLGATNKMKYWDLYAEFYHVLNQRNEQGLPTLFAEELARTYAERAGKKK